MWPAEGDGPARWPDWPGTTGVDRPASWLREEIDLEHRRLRGLLPGCDLAVPAVRPPTGRWSAAENLRHLIFAEQVQLGRFLPAGRRSILGEPTANDRRHRMDTTDFRTLADLLARLAEVHAETAVLVRDPREAVQRRMATNLRHLRAHIEVIERPVRLSG